MGAFDDYLAARERRRQRDEYARQRQQEAAGAEWLSAIQEAPDLATFQKRFVGAPKVIGDPALAIQYQNAALSQRNALQGLQTAEKAKTDEVTINDFLKKVDASGLTLPSEMPNSYGVRPTLPELTKDIGQYAANEGFPQHLVPAVAEKYKGLTRDFKVENVGGELWSLDGDTGSAGFAPGFTPPPKYEKDAQGNLLSIPRVGDPTVISQAPRIPVKSEDFGGYVREYFPDGTFTDTRKTAAPRQPGTGGGQGGGKPRYVQYTGPDGTSRMVNVNDDGERKEAEAQGWQPGTKKKRVIPSAVEKRLTGAASLADTMDRLSGGFQDRFGGKGILGDTRLKIQAIAGTDPDETAFWQDYQSFVNDVRNERFGAALTPQEKREFDKEIINSNMSPKVIRNRIRKQKELVEKAINRLSAGYAKDYDQEQIETFTGRPVGGNQPKAPQGVVPAKKPGPRGETHVVQQGGKWYFVAQNGDQWETVINGKRYRLE